jgi:hypothetical protein
MLSNVPITVSILFILTAILTLILFVNSFLAITPKSVQRKTLWVLLVWLVVQTGLTFRGAYYGTTDVLPPRILLFGVLPTILAMVLLLKTKSGRKFSDHLSLKQLTLLSVVRVPVEIVLWMLFLNHTIPDIMTFEGWNFDILAGITAPLIVYFGIKQKTRKTLLIAWNIVGIVMLTWIVVIATLASPFPLQQLAFDQPNIAILYFPFSLLPTFVVPVVYFSHLASLRLLLKKPKIAG